MNKYKLRFDKIKTFFRKIKWSFQRMKKGYCDYDVGDLDYWFLDIIVKMLKDLKKNKQGVPEDAFVVYFKEHPELGNYEDFLFYRKEYCRSDIETKTKEKWDSILDRMILCFTEANEDNTQEKYNESYEEAYQHSEKMLKEGLQLFYKYFHNLWI